MTLQKALIPGLAGPSAAPLPEAPVSRLARIVVAATGPRRPRGLLVAGGLSVPCALGRAGIAGRKREGDGATPRGIMHPVVVYFRADRLRRPATALPVRALRPADGWCDDPADRRYNRPVRLPYAGRHEALWRSDRVYDVIVVLDYNLTRPRRSAGSAIFLHIARPGYPPTAGCIAVAPDAMRRLLARVDARTAIEIR